MYLNDETKKIQNQFFINTFGMTYDEFDLLDFDKQEELIEKYHKEHSQTQRTYGEVAFGSGDNLMLVKYPKGTKILTSNGYVVAGETIDEYKQKMQKKEEAVFGKIGISSSPSFLRRFFEKFRCGELKIETLPQVQVGKKFTGTEEEVNKELESYQRLLDSGIIEEAAKKEQGPVKKLVPNNKK